MGKGFGQEQQPTSGAIEYFDGRIWWIIQWVKIVYINGMATLDRCLVSSARNSLSDLSSDQEI